MYSMIVFFAILELSELEDIFFHYKASATTGSSGDSYAAPLSTLATRGSMCAWGYVKC